MYIQIKLLVHKMQVFIFINNVVFIYVNLQIIIYLIYYMLYMLHFYDDYVTILEHEINYTVKFIFVYN